MYSKGLLEFLKIATDGGVWEHDLGKSPKEGPNHFPEYVFL